MDLISIIEDQHKQALPDEPGSLFDKIRRLEESNSALISIQNKLERLSQFHAEMLLSYDIYDILEKGLAKFQELVRTRVCSVFLVHEHGYQFVSLSGAPFIHPEGRELTPVDQVLTRIGELIEPMYGFKSLHRFKQKFNPREEPLYLLYRDEGDLPRIGVALTRAYLPDATLRDLIASAAPASGSSAPAPASAGCGLSA